MRKHQPDPSLLAKQFKQNPTLETFLEIRRAHPEVEFDVSYLGGIDQLFALESMLESYGIPARLYAQVLDANHAAIQKMSLLIMKDMRREELLKYSGETHVAARGKVMPQHLRDWLTCCMIGALSWNDERSICTDLIALLHFRLISGTSRMEEIFDVHQKKRRACFLAAMLKAKGIEFSFRKVANLLRVQPSTVKRWFASEAEFREEAEQLSALFNTDGSFKSLFPPTSKTLHTE